MLLKNIEILSNTSGLKEHPKPDRIKIFQSLLHVKKYFSLIPMLFAESFELCAYQLPSCDMK